MDDNLEKLKDVIVEQFGVDRAIIKEASSFVHDLGADSLDTVELVMAFEEQFDVNIPDSEAEKITTVGQALEYINAHAK